MELNGEDRISQVIKSAVNNEKIKISERETLTPVYMGDAAKLITKWLFSFGPYGEATSVSSNNLLVTNICQIIKRTYPNFNYRVVQEAPRIISGTKKRLICWKKRQQIIRGNTFVVKKKFYDAGCFKRTNLRLGLVVKCSIVMVLMAALLSLF